MEFGSLRTLWMPPKFLALHQIHAFWSRKFPIIHDGHGDWRSRRAWLSSYKFLLRFLWALRRFRYQDVGPRQLESVYRDVTGCKIVGDKLPAYVLSLEQYVLIENLKVVVIHRHPAAVIRSYLELVQGNWRRIPTLNRFNNEVEVAKLWAQSVGILRRHWESVLPISYERLCEDPVGECRKLGEWFDIEPEGFDLSCVQAPKPLPRFSDEVLGQIREVVHEECSFLGYELD